MVRFGFLPRDAESASALPGGLAGLRGAAGGIVTINLKFSRWGSVFGDDQMAAIDRVAHHSRLLRFRGEYHCVRHAPMQCGA